MKTFFFVFMIAIGCLAQADQWGASHVLGVASSGRNYDLCFYFDRSVIEQQTFLEGPQSVFNQEMNQALGLH